MMRLRVVATVVTATMIAVGCSSGPTPLPPGDASGADSANPAVPAAPGSSVPGLPEAGGRLAVGGSDGLKLLDSKGVEVAVLHRDAAAVTQPTWSRSGDRVVATVIGGGGVQTTVVDADGADAVLADAARAYFFYSWSSDGTHIAALGPGPRGTSLDVLNDEGVVVSDQPVDTASFYLAWEPRGDDLLIHTDAELALVTDVEELSATISLGSPGQAFLAPAWIPGTRDALIVESGPDGGRLVRIDVDSGERDDLGPVSGSVGIMVASDGTRALLAHSDVVAGTTTFASFDPTEVQVAEQTAATELIDLGTGQRTVVSRAPAIWAEWSPDGESIVLLQPSDSGVEWAIWDGNRIRRLGGFLPSPTFFQNYLFFAPQYVESPRLWAPDSSAIVYSAIDDSEPAIFVQRIDQAEAVRVADGDIAFWSPG